MFAYVVFIRYILPHLLCPTYCKPIFFATSACKAQPPLDNKVVLFRFGIDISQAVVSPSTIMKQVPFHDKNVKNNY